jgi:predicted porin
MVAGTAQAQSSVTVYGILDMGVTERKDDVAGTVTKNKTTAEGGAYTTQRLGVRGDEDLGGGLKASFNFELGLGANGGTGNRIRGAGAGATAASTTVANTNDYKADQSMSDTVIRQQNVGLAGGFGSVRVGRMTTLADVVYGIGDVGGGNNFQGRTYSTAGVNNVSARSDRLIEYVSPSFNGITIGLQYGQASSAAATTGKGEETGAMIRYAAGPLVLAAATQNHKDTIASVTQRDASVTLLAGSYNFGAAQAFVNYQDGEVKNDYGTATTPFQDTPISTAAFQAGALAERKATEIGVAIPMGKWRLAASYYDGENNSRTTSSGALTQRDVSGYQLAGLYSLSKRTTVYAVYGYGESKPTSGAKSDITDMGVGIRHSF